MSETNKDLTNQPAEASNEEREQSYEKVLDLIEEYQREIKDIPFLNADEELELIDRIKQVDIEARNEFVKHYLRFVLWTARKYITENDNLSLEDLVQAGNEGLILAANKYNPTKNVKFMTYASHWINGEIRKEIEIQRTSIKYTDEERTRREKIFKQLSLDDDTMNDGENSLLDILADDKPEPLEEMLRKEAETEAKEAISVLSEEEHNVIELLYLSEENVNYRSIAKKLNMSEFEVKRLEKTALNKLQQRLDK